MGTKVPRLPKEFTSLDYSDHRNLFDTYSPDYYQMATLGYIRDSYSDTFDGAYAPIEAADGVVLPKSLDTDVFPTMGSGVEEVEVYSDNAGDTGALAVIGTDLFGDEYCEVVVLQGTTPILLEEIFITVHQLIYAPINQLTANNWNLGNIYCRQLANHDGEAGNACYRNLTMRIGVNKASNCIYRCPKFQSALIPYFTFSAQGSCGAGARFHVWERFWPGDWTWYKQSVYPVKDGTNTVLNTGKRGLREGDFIMIAADSIDPTNTNIYWQMRVIHAILDHAPADYERPWRSVLGEDPWPFVPPG